MHVSIKGAEVGGAMSLTGDGNEYPQRGFSNSKNQIKIEKYEIYFVSKLLI